MWSAPQRRRATQLQHLRAPIRLRSGSVSDAAASDRSNRPASPSARNRSRHLRTVLASTWNRSAVASIVQPCSSTQRHHPPPTLRGQRRVRVLASSVSHEPSLRDVSCGRPTASHGGLTSTADHQHHPARDNVPGRHSWPTREAAHNLPGRTPTCARCSGRGTTPPTTRPCRPVATRTATPTGTTTQQSPTSDLPATRRIGRPPSTTLNT